MSADIRISHVIRYINAMVPKDKKTMQDAYPVEMTETEKTYIVAHLQAIKEKISCEQKAPHSM